MELIFWVHNFRQWIIPRHFHITRDMSVIENETAYLLRARNGKTFITNTKASIMKTLIAFLLFVVGISLAKTSRLISNLIFVFVH